MSYYDSLPDTSQLRHLLDGQVPNESWPLNRTDKLLASWQAAMDQWVFVGKWFEKAKQNYRMPIPVMPTLAWISLVGGQVPSFLLAHDIIMSAPSSKVWGAGERIYSCYTGWVRELHVGLYLAQFGTVTKNPIDDLEHGVDWYFRGKKIAVTREGAASKKYWRQRKGDKTDQDAIVLTAKGSEGLVLVDEKQIEAKCLKLAEGETEFLS